LYFRAETATLLTKRLILLHCLLLTAFCVSAQQGNHHFINFGAKDGLPDKFVYCAAQDDRGYMWFGTGSGLYRFDGHRFVHYNSNADLPGHSIGNILQTILKDEAGHLWLGGLNALQLFDPVSGTFWTPGHSNPGNEKVQHASIQRFNTGLHDNIWVSTQYSYFFRFNKKDSSFTHFNRYPATASKSVISVIETSAAILAVHSEGIYQFTTDGAYINFYGIPGDKITSATEDKKNNQVLCTTNKSGIALFNIQKGRYNTTALFNQRLKGSQLFCVTPSADGTILYAGSYNFDIINTVTNQHYQYSQSKNEFELSATKIANVYLDRENNAWLCSHFGLSMMPWQNHQVDKCTLIDKISGNGVEPIQAFATPPGREILISNTSASGLMLYDTDEKKLLTIINSLGNNKNIAAVIAAPGNRWFASDDNSIYEYQPGLRRFIPFTLTDQWGHNIKNAGRSVVDQQGRIYNESRSNGFYIWQYPSGTVTHYNKWDADKADSSKASNTIIPCLADSKNNIWFTSDNGIYRYNIATKLWHHTGQKEEGNMPAMRESNDVAEDKRGHIWITSVVNGLYEWYLENGKERLHNYNRNSGIGLPADFCWRLQQSPVDSSLWISNITGLLKFDPVAKQVTSIFTRQNGLEEDNGGYTFSILPGNKLVQLFYASFNIIDLNLYKENRLLPQVQFNSVKVLDKEYASQLNDNSSKLALDHRENFIQFEFAALVFNNANRNRYAWQLSGIDTNWIYGGPDNHVSYAALKPGRYIFRVKAANNDGYWGPEKKIDFTIQPPFYARWWFLVICVLVITAVLYAVYRGKIRQARRAEKIKAGFQQQIAGMEMKALRAQMNPHFIFNSLNSIQKYILRNDQLNTSQYLTKFSRLIRLILDHSDQNSITLSSELELLKLYLEMESMRFDNRFQYEILVDKTINTENMLIPSMLLQPYIENAVWHGLLHKEDKGSLVVHFSLQQNNLCVMIDDDGIGRDKATELKSKQLLTKKSYGMQITRDRIALINKLEGTQITCSVMDKKDNVGNAAGTLVQLTIPVTTLKN